MMGGQNSKLPIGLQRQMEIYEKGLLRKAPSQPVKVEELEQKAKERLKQEAYDYLTCGAGAEDTIRANREAFQHWHIVPRFLRNVEQRDLSVELFGQTFQAPILLAPIGVQSILHKKAELAVARAARSVNMGLVLSSLSSTTMEDVAEAIGDVPHWFQLYWPKNPELTASFLQRAERAGYSALVVTLDTYLLSWRERDIQNAYLPFLKGEGLANFFSDPVFCSALEKPLKKNLIGAIRYFTEIFSNPALTWSDLPFLRQHTRQPILLKGILDPEDARRAIDHGMDGIIVSNHGGRQLDGAIAALEALPRVVDAVGDRLPVLFDSGIRRGPDIVKALALGAKCVLLGRPYCLGLAVNGEQGVADVLRNLLADFDLTLGLAGCASLSELNRDMLVENKNS